MSIFFLSLYHFFIHFPRYLARTQNPWTGDKTAPQTNCSLCVHCALCRVTFKNIYNCQLIKNVFLFHMTFTPARR